VKSWTTFPLWPILPDGSCGCRNPACKDAGKHPSVKWGKHSLTAGTQLPIPEGYGTGLATGERSGVVVVDIDMKNGVNGLANLLALGEIPSTLTVHTPTGGAHLYFSYPGFKVSNSVSSVTNGVDIRGDGGFVVIPPSPHKCGHCYSWVDPTVPIADMPAWLLDRIKHPHKTQTKVTSSEAEALAKRWARATNANRRRLGLALSAVLKGEPFAQHGERDTVLFQLTKDIAREFPDADPASIAALFAMSCDVMVDGPTVDQVAEKFSRAASEIPSWHAELSVGEGGKIQASHGNALLIMRQDAAWKGCLGYDERTLQAVWLKRPPFECPGVFPRGVEDSDAVCATVWFQTSHGIALKSGVISEAIHTAAKDKPFDRFRDWIKSLVWDGKFRVDQWLYNYAAADDTPYTRAVGAKFLLSLVARTLYPGCKVDTMLILEGEQGIGKSTLLCTLVGQEWFRDQLPELSSKDSLIQLQGPALIEVAELASFNRKETEAVKSFLTVTHDTFRPPYGRTSVTVPRRLVFAGTTNEQTYLTDHTGNRRYWPVRVSGRCNLEGLATDRAQLLAEARTRLEAGERWWLEGEGEALAVEEQEAHLIQDTLEEALGTMLRGVTSTTTNECMAMMDIPHLQRNRAAEMRIGRILTRRLGFKRSQGRADGRRHYLYTRSESAAGGKKAIKPWN
jgi:predicted P-loop ATPase